MARSTNAEGPTIPTTQPTNLPASRMPEQLEVSELRFTGKLWHKTENF